MAYAIRAVVDWAFGSVSRFTAELQTHAGLLERRAYGACCSRFRFRRVLGNAWSAAAYGESRIVEIDAVYLVRQHSVEVSDNGGSRSAWFAEGCTVDRWRVSLRYSRLDRTASLRSLH